MPPLFRLLPFFALLLAPLAASTSPDLDTVRQADDARVTATLAADRAGLAAVLSNDLHYCHSSGMINDKATLIEHIAGGTTRYQVFKYEDRQFTPAGPGIVLMTGHCRVRTVTAGKPNDLHLTFLGVWRNEGGVWRFLAWQSCKLPPDPA